MKKNSLIIVSIVALVVFSAPGFADAEDLIPPSRTLETAEQVPGEVSLFSEPPGLEVFINKESAGLTPARGISLNPGIHSLQIEKAELEFEIGSSQHVQFSFFNGQIIKIPDPEPPPVIDKQAAAESMEKPAVEPRPQPAKAQSTRRQKSTSGLSSWDLFINGSSGHF